MNYRGGISNITLLNSEIQGGKILKKKTIFFIFPLHFHVHQIKVEESKKNSVILFFIRILTLKIKYF